MRVEVQEEKESPRKKKKEKMTKGFMNDPSILPPKKRSKNDKIKTKADTDDYDDPEKEWEVLVRNLIFFRRKETRTMKIDYNTNNVGNRLVPNTSLN